MRDAPQPTLDAVVITRDEAVDLPGLLANALAFCDRVVVVDDRSTDGTPELVREWEDREPGRVVLVEREMRSGEGFAAQRNAGLDASTADWVLHLDADMRATPEAAAEIRRAISAASESAFRVRLLNHFLHRPVRGGGWQHWNKPWLARRGAHRFVGEVHERVEVGGGVGQIAAPLWHLNDADWTERVRKNTQYMQASGQRIVERGVRVRWVHMVAHPLWRALKSYTVQGGWRDGTRGVMLAMYTLTGTFNWWAYAWDAQNRIPRERLEGELRDRWAAADSAVAPRVPAEAPAA